MWPHMPLIADLVSNKWDGNTKVQKVLPKLADRRNRGRRVRAQLSQEVANNDTTRQTEVNDLSNALHRHTLNMM